MAATRRQRLLAGVASVEPDDDRRCATRGTTITCALGTVAVDGLNYGQII